MVMVIGLREVLARHLLDPRRHGGREQHGLGLVRQGVEDGVEVLGEAHVEHLVGLVEHDDLDGLEVEAAAGEVVDGPARGGDDDVDAAVQGVQLAADGLAAVDREHPGAEAAAVAVDGLGDLHGQLAGRARARPRWGPCPGRRGPGARGSGSANAAVLPVPVAAWPSSVAPGEQRPGWPRPGSAWAPRSRARRARR